MKITVITVLIVISFICHSNGHNVTWGIFNYNDRLLARDIVRKSGSWMSTSSMDLIYPPKGHFNNAIIKAVRIWDWGGPKHYTYTSLVNGGPGYSNVTIHFKSQRGMAINCTVEYYGR